MGGTLIKVISITKNNIHPSLIYLEGHPSNYLVTSDKTWDFFLTHLSGHPLKIINITITYIKHSWLIWLKLKIYPCGVCIMVDIN